MIEELKRRCKHYKNLEGINMQWEKQEGLPLWLPQKEDDEIVGEITSINTDGIYGVDYTIKKDDGEEMRLPSHKVLQNRMIKAKTGSKVKIVFTGEEPPKVKGQNPLKMYDVFIGK